MIKVYEINNVMAGIVPMASASEQENLNRDVADAGKLFLPIVLWKNQIVDGRCRQIACIAANIEMDVKHLDASLPVEEVAKEVKALNTRRNLTMTQKALSALKQQQTFGWTNAEIVRRNAIGKDTFKNTKYIANFSTQGFNTKFFNTETPIEDLFNGKYLQFALEGQYKFSNKISSITTYIKSHLQVTEEINKLQWIDVSELIESIAGKEWYRDNLSIIGGEKVNINIREAYAELANFKFPVIHELHPSEAT